MIVLRGGREQKTSACSRPQCKECPNGILRSQVQRGERSHPYCALDIYDETIVACLYCSNSSYGQIAQQFKIGVHAVRKILKRRGIQPRNHMIAARIRCNTPPLNLPLPTEVGWLLRNPTNIKFFPLLIAVMLLTDGSAGRMRGKRAYICFFNRAEVLHCIFATLMLHAYGMEPSSYCNLSQSYLRRTGRQYYMTDYQRAEIEPVLRDLEKLSPTFRHSPKHGESWKQFLREGLQPSVAFLTNSKRRIPREVAAFAARLAMSCDGSIIARHRCASCRPGLDLQFSCVHPGLRRQWQEFFAQLGIHFLATKAALRSYNPEGAAAFLNLGGFISGVAVGANGYLGGVDRQAVLKALLVDREKLSIDPNLPLVVKRQRFRQMALAFHSEEPASDDGARHAKGVRIRNLAVVVNEIC